jgi:hypothetical protein
VTDKTRLKNLKQLVLQDLNLQDMCAVRLFKEGIPLIGEMDLVKDFVLEQIEAELYYSIHIQVENMGGQYQRQIEVSPQDSIDSIRHKVNFFSLFSQRNYKLVTDGGNTIEREQYATLPFSDSGLRNGSKLIMKPPVRERAEREGNDDAQQEADSDEDQEGMQMGEEGFVFGEGGEDEMLEMHEGGEDQMDEDPEDPDQEEGADQEEELNQEQ